MLNYLIKGNPDHPSVLFLHGFMGCAEDWYAVIDQLSVNYYCLAIDLPGHGLSQMPDISDSQLIGYLTDSINSLLDFLQIAQIFVVGYSMGGRAALEMIRHNGKILRGVILESASPGIREEEEKAIRLRSDLELAARLEKDNFRQFLYEWYRQPLFASLFAAAGPDILIEKRIANDPKQLAQFLRGFSVARQESSWPLLKILELPCMYIAGQEDIKYAGIAKEINRLNRRIESVIVEKAGHNVHFEQTDVFLNLIRRFLQNQV